MNINVKTITEVLVEFIVIFVIFTISVYPYVFTRVAVSSLGRFIAIMFIVIITTYNTSYGLIACILVIIFYRTTYIEGFEEELTDEQKPILSLVGKISVIPDISDNSLNINFKEFKKKKTEGFIEYRPLSGTSGGGSDNSGFRNKHCSAEGDLEYKDFKVNREMAQHIFTDVKYTNNDNCNLCDPNCSYTVASKTLDMKLKTEEMLTRI